MALFAPTTTSQLQVSAHWRISQNCAKFVLALIGSEPNFPEDCALQWHCLFTCTYQYKWTSSCEQCSVTAVHNPRDSLPIIMHWNKFCTPLHNFGKILGHPELKHVFIHLTISPLACYYLSFANAKCGPPYGNCILSSDIPLAINVVFCYYSFSNKQQRWYQL